ncbi:hypothetical protein PI126_g5066 [Phytophthora idaei]|nr:hypothetical protein PI126_g5066 [Phytophthora idaei]
MDKCVMEDKDITTCNLIGQFVPVSAFLEMLGAAKMKVRIPGMLPAKSDVVESFQNWLKGWDGWQMRFTHFVQLGLEPNESPLWYLLGRRAAGSFACSHRCGADLLIPIFRRKSNGGVNTEHEKLCPSFVFQDRTKKSENSSLNPLSEKAVSDVVRININVQDEDNNTHRFIYATPSKDNKMLSFEGVA